MGDTVFRGDETLYRLTMDVYTYQQRARTEWMNSVVHEVRVTDKDIVDVFKQVGLRSLVEGGKSVATNIPEYGSYGEVWEKAWYPNPFEFNWFTFDNNSDSFAMAYMMVVSQTLQEQIDIWGTDLDTRSSLIYWYITEFSRKVERLYEYLDEQGRDDQSSSRSA